MNSSAASSSARSKGCGRGNQATSLPKSLSGVSCRGICGQAIGAQNARGLQMLNGVLIIQAGEMAVQRK